MSNLTHFKCSKTKVNFMSRMLEKFHVGSGSGTNWKVGSGSEKNHSARSTTMIYRYVRTFLHRSHTGNSPVQGVGKFRIRLKSSSVDLDSGFWKVFLQSSGSRSRSRRAKMTHKHRKKLYKFHFFKGWMFSFEGFPCSLDIKIAIFDKKKVRLHWIRIHSSV